MEKKDTSFILRLSKDELNALTRKASELGISKANLIRLNLLNLLKYENTNNPKRTQKN
jgi:predicted DNA binding CopG/RHH family protein